MATAYSTTLTVRENKAVYKALEILKSKLIKDKCVFDCPSMVIDFLKLKLGFETREVFSVIFLDAQNRMIDYQPMFYGSVTETSVHIGEVVKKALSANAVSIIFSHNHPSGKAKQSKSDELLTQQLKAALQLVDIKTLDHIIVAGNQTLSFSEKGLL